MSDHTAVPIHVDLATEPPRGDRAVESVGLSLPGVRRVFAVGDPGPGRADALVDQFRAADDPPVRWSVHADERALLAELSRFAHARLVDRDPVLVAFEGGTAGAAPACWDFRRRAGRIDPACPLVGLPYVDCARLVRDRVDAAAARSLERACRVLRDEGWSDVGADEALASLDGVAARPVVGAGDAGAVADRTDARLARSLAALLRLDVVTARVVEADGAHEPASHDRPDALPRVPDAG